MRVWITRAEPGASRTAERLRSLGHEPLVAPLLQVEALSPKLDLNSVAALAFTSANAVDAYARLSPERDLPVFAVGTATAEAARAAGFAGAESANGDVHALAALIAARAPAGFVLHPCAEDPAADLAEMLTAAGVQTRSVAVYRTSAVEKLPEAVALTSAIPGAEPEALLLHSPKAARTLTALADRQSEGARLRYLPAVCISLAAAEPLSRAGFADVRSAAEPNEAAMLELLRRLG